MNSRFGRYWTLYRHGFHVLRGRSTLPDGAAWIVQFGAQDGAFIAGQSFRSLNSLLASSKATGSPEFDAHGLLLATSGWLRLFPNEAIYDITFTYDDASTQRIAETFITTTGWQLPSGLNRTLITKISASLAQVQPLTLMTSDQYHLITSDGFRILVMP